MRSMGEGARDGARPRPLAIHSGQSDWRRLANLAGAALAPSTPFGGSPPT